MGGNAPEHTRGVGRFRRAPEEEKVSALGEAERRNEHIVATASAVDKRAPPTAVPRGYSGGEIGSPTEGHPSALQVSGRICSFERPLSFAS